MIIKFINLFKVKNINKLMIKELDTFVYENEYEEELKCDECTDLDRPGVKVFYIGITGCIISCVMAAPIVSFSMFVVGMSGIVHSFCTASDDKKNR